MNSKINLSMKMFIQKVSSSKPVCMYFVSIFRFEIHSPQWIFHWKRYYLSHVFFCLRRDGVFDAEMNKTYLLVLFMLLFLQCMLFFFSNFSPHFVSRINTSLDGYTTISIILWSIGKKSFAVHNAVTLFQKKKLMTLIYIAEVHCNLFSIGYWMLRIYLYWQRHRYRTDYEG